jgi:hypothetical protein
MNTNGHELVLREEVFEIVGCAMEVLYGIGLTCRRRLRPEDQTACGNL